MSRTLTLVFGNVQRVHLGKDVFLVPYYLGKALGLDVRIIYPMSELNKDLPSEHRGVKLIPIAWRGEIIHNRVFKLVVMIMIWIRYVMPSDVLMLFHYYQMRTPRWGVIYKIFHPHGKLYVKLDADSRYIKKEDAFKNLFDKVYRMAWHTIFARIVDCITCETQAGYNAIMNSKSSIYKFRNKLFVMPNGFDNEGLSGMNIKIKSYAEKKDQFITVGRIGATPKNTEMLLRALRNVDLKDWKMIVIGPYNDNFALKIDTFFCENSGKSENIVFMGNITDKQVLWNLYNESKVFVFTSDYESFGLVFLEAAMFHNYIVSTNVGAFPDVTQNGKYGESVPLDDDTALAKKMQDIVDGRADIDCYDDNYCALVWSEVIRPVADRLR